MKSICCAKMEQAIATKGQVPINFVEEDGSYGVEYICRDSSIWSLLNEPYDALIAFCPFCGKNISVIKVYPPEPLEGRSNLCGGFLSWFGKGVPEPRLFEYNHTNNQFYMHSRRNFGDKFIPISYCIYCGEPLSEMVDKYGIPAEISNNMRTDEWWKKRGL